MTEEEIRLNALDYCNETKEYGETIVERYTKQLAYTAGARVVNKEVEALRAEIEKLRNPWISVSEELPSQKKGLSSSVDVMVRLRDGDYRRAYYRYDTKSWCDNHGYNLDGEVGAWKSIDE